MEEVLPSYHAFINHRGRDVKKTLASLIYHSLRRHGLRVFFDQQELQVGDPLTPAIKSAICGASVQIAIFSGTYAQSAWCLNELLWMLDSHPTSSKIIPIFYDIQPSDLRYVDRGAYAGAFQDHRNNGRVTIEQVDSWIRALNKVSHISGVVINTEEDDLGERLEKIVEIVLKELRKEQLDVCAYPVGLDQAVKDFEKAALNPSELINVVGIVGLGGWGKSTLVTHLYNSKRSQFYRSCFLSDVSKNNLLSLQETLYRDLLQQILHIQNARQGKSLLQDRLRGLRVLIVFDDIDNTEQIDNLLFVKNVVGNGSLILVTSRDTALLVSSMHEVKIYNVKLLDPKHAQELFCWHAFRQHKPRHDLQNMVKEFVSVCCGIPLALKVLAGRLHNERDPERWKRHLESLHRQLPNDLLKQIIMDSYESLDDREKEAFLDVAHFLLGEDTDLVERVLDGLNDDGFQYLQTLRHKCLVEFESADIIRGRAIRGESVNSSIDVWGRVIPDESENWSISVCRRAKGTLKIRMHDLVRDLARQIGRQELPLRLCCSNDALISIPVFGYHDSVQKYDVRGICRDEDYQLPVFLQNKDICGLKLLSVQKSTILQKFNSVSGDLTWFRWRQSEDTLNPSPFLHSRLSNLLLRSLRVLEVNVVSLQDFLNFVDDREPPSQLGALEVTCTGDFGSQSRAGLSSDSSQPLTNLGQWFQGCLPKLNFKNLHKIVLQNIPGLTILPIKFEEVRNLRHVNLSYCRDLEFLPDSFTEELLQLQYLALRDCRKLVLQDLGKISTLEYLDFQGCSMLWEMPKGTEVQKSLKYLNVVHTKLRKLPQQLEQLEYLEELHIGSSELTEIPSSLYNLSRLTDLTLLGCTKLLSIDNSIEKLLSLESFRIYDCGLKALPERIAWMNMKILDVQRCPLELEELLIGVDSGNMPLDSSQAQRSIDQGAYPNCSSCLRDLIIRDSYISKMRIPWAESLEIVDLSCNHLLTDIGSLPGNLISLKLMNCSKLRTLACLSNMARLKILDISGCDELETLNVEGLSSIEVIKGSRCLKLRNIQGLHLLEKLSYFQISFNRICTPMFNLFWIFHPSFVSITVLEMVKSPTSHESKECYFAEVKPKGTILLYLITHPGCKIETVARLGHAYTSHSSRSDTSDTSVHILMWTKDSEVFTDRRFRSEAIRFDITINAPSPEAPGLKRGWMVEAKNVLEMSPFLSYGITVDMSHQP